MIHRAGLSLLAKKALLRLAHAYVAPGRKASAYLGLLGAKPSHIFIAPNCIDLTLFSMGSGTARRPRRLVVCGRLTPLKNVDLVLTAIDLAGLNHEFTLTIVGTGPLETNYVPEHPRWVLERSSVDMYPTRPYPGCCAIGCSRVSYEGRCLGFGSK